MQREKRHAWDSLMPAHERHKVMQSGVGMEKIKDVGEHGGAVAYKAEECKVISALAIRL